MSIWMVLGAAGVVSLILLYLGFLQDRSRGRPRCPKCWYNMTGAPSLVCPECGHDARQSRRLYRTRRRRWAIPCAVLLVVMWAYLWQVRVRVVGLRESLAGAWKPTSYLLLRLPHSSSEDQGALGNRIKRSGLWPWESWTFLLHFNRQVSAASPGLPSWVHLARPAAEHSPRVLDRMVELWDDSNSGLRHLAQATVAENSAGVTDTQLYRLLDCATEWSNSVDSHIHSACRSMLLEMMRRDPSGSRGGTRTIIEELVARCGHVDEQVQRSALVHVGICAGLLTGADLSRLLDVALRRFTRFHDGPTDYFLTEMVRRRRREFRDQIARWVADPSPEDRWRPKMFPELVTALRRIEGEHDPLQIFVEGAPMITCRAASLPTVHVTIRNVDAAGAAIGFQRGGDDRSGRPARWRFDVRDQRGHCHPIKQLRSDMGGGISVFDVLKYGECYETDLDINKFLEPLPPGRYRVVVQYHNSHTIADDEDASNRIMSVSEPFELIVRR